MSNYALGIKEPGLQGAFNLLGITENHLDLEMSNQKVYFMNEPPHLLNRA